VRTVLRARDPAEAYRARDLLRENGIAAEVSFETRAAPGLPLDLEPVAEVWIAEEARLEEARALLAELETGGAGGPPWTCACGAENESAFDACPTCGAER
jgi:Putative prokaryotic signal transducing protein